MICVCLFVPIEHGQIVSYRRRKLGAEVSLLKSKALRTWRGRRHNHY